PWLEVAMKIRFMSVAAEDSPRTPPKPGRILLRFTPDSQVPQANARGLAYIEKPPQNENKHTEHGNPRSRSAVPCPHELDLHAIRSAADRNQHLASAFPRCGLHRLSIYFCSPRRIVK